MDCPHCKVPLMGKMTVCPKCSFDTAKPGLGGENHILWLLEHNEPLSYNQKTVYKPFIDKYEEERSEEFAEKKRLEEEQKRLAEENREREKVRQKEIANVMISSGFSFEGYRIVKYSGYISGDDAIQIPRGGIFGRNHGQDLTNALVEIRRQALAELKEAALELGCNAVIGVDFDYITLDPETANALGGTLYEPYVICVTANGNAVLIEKI